MKWRGNLKYVIKVMRETFALKITLALATYLNWSLLWLLQNLEEYLLHPFALLFEAVARLPIPIVGLYVGPVDLIGSELLQVVLIKGWLAGVRIILDPKFYPGLVLLIYKHLLPRFWLFDIFDDLNNAEVLCGRI